jgi:DNA-binding transcriptional LysR family regulator
MNRAIIAETAWFGRHFGDRRFSFRTNSQTTQAAAARAGYGVALLPRYIVAIHEPDLVQVSPGGRLPERDVWLLVRRDLKNVPRVRALTDYLVEVFQRERRLLAA